VDVNIRIDIVSDILLASFTHAALRISQIFSLHNVHISQSNFLNLVLVYQFSDVNHVSLLFHPTQQFDILRQVLIMIKMILLKKIKFLTFRAKVIVFWPCVTFSRSCVIVEIFDAFLYAGNFRLSFAVFLVKSSLEPLRTRPWLSWSLEISHVTRPEILSTETIFHA
jgi:hypothetical protein